MITLPVRITLTPFRQRLLFCLGFCAALGVLLTLATALAGAGCYYALRVLPEQTFAATHSAAWASRNVSLMEFRAQPDFDRAEQGLIRAIHSRQDAASPIPYFLLAELYNAEDKQSKAMSNYRQALALSQNNWIAGLRYRQFANRSLAAMAIICYKNNNFKEASRLLHRVSSWNDLENPQLSSALVDALDHPEQADAHWILAKSLKTSYQLREARGELQKTLACSRDPQLIQQASIQLQTQLQPEMASLTSLARYYILAGDTAQYETHQLQQAAWFYEKALVATPGLAAVNGELADTYRQLKQFHKARLAIQRAIAANPENYRHYLTLGDIANDSEHFQEAIQVYEKAQLLIAESSDAGDTELNANLENQIAYAYEAINLPKDALQHYRLAMMAAVDGNNAVDANEDTVSENYDYAQDSIERLQQPTARVTTASGTHRDELSSL